ncbi:MAG: hypothetical protein KDJ17_08435 [Hyphomicrobiaceae bacterium]|nr:hypothetical protein [Hyphomicrobiaceae bacterium]
MSLGMALSFLALAVLVLGLLGYLPGSDVEQTTGVVTWSRVDTRWKGDAYSKIRARLSNGEEIYTTAPRTPPPAQGETISLKVRQNILGMKTYVWMPGPSRTP